MKKLNKKGVSLAELLAVVVIMGIIAAIAIPLVGNVIETSKKKAFIGDLITIKEAVQTYCAVDGEDKVGTLCKKNGGDVLIYEGKDVKTATLAIQGESEILQKYISKKFVDIVGEEQLNQEDEGTGKITINISATGAITIGANAGNNGGYTIAKADPTVMKPEDVTVVPKQTVFID